MPELIHAEQMQKYIPREKKRAGERDRNTDRDREIDRKRERERCIYIFPARLEAFIWMHFKAIDDSNTVGRHSSTHAKYTQYVDTY